MNKLSIAALACLVLATSAHAGPRPGAVHGALSMAGNTVRPAAQMAMAKLPASTKALPGLGAVGGLPAPVGLHLAGLNLLGTNGQGLVAGVGVLGGANVGHGIAGVAALGGANSGRGLIGAAALSGAGSGQGVVSVGVLNAGQSPVHVGVLGMNLIGH